MTTLERMNPLDAWFLYAEEDGVNHMNILSFIVLDGPPPPYEDLLALVASKLPQLPRYRQVIRTVPMHIGRPVWVDDANFDLQFHVRQTALAAPGDDVVLERLISRLMAQQFDRARPLWELWSVEGLTDGRWVLLSKLHHAMVDGVSAPTWCRSCSTRSASRRPRRRSRGSRRRPLRTSRSSAAPRAGS